MLSILVSIINHRRRLASGWVALFIFLVTPVTEAAKKLEPAKPNIVFILTDDLGYGELGSYGQKKIRTPHLDRLASEGMRFTQHYSGSPVCAPSRCVLLTGKHTGHARIRGNDEFPKGVDLKKNPHMEGQHPLPAGTVTLPGLLKKAGYTTAAFGKWGLGAAETEGAPWHHGFDYFYGYLCQRQAHNHYPTHLWRNGERHVLEGNSQGNLTGKHYAHDLLVEEALGFVGAHRDKPFFLYLPFHIPHVAVQAPEDSVQEYAGQFPETPYTGNKGYLPHPTPRAAYAAMITRMDRDVGRLMDLLKELNLEKRTLVMFSSDNGPAWNGGADPEFFESANGFRGLKATVYEGGIRVPLIARWPGKIKPGTVSDHVSAFWDILPTLAEVAGVKALLDVDGISLVPTLLGKRGQKRHGHLYWEYPEKTGSQAIRLGDWKAVRLDAKKNLNGPLELYNLAKDPGETVNLAEAHPGLVKRLESLMALVREDSSVPYWNYGP